MQIERPCAKELSLQENQELAQLKGLIEKAIADGQITRQENEMIQTALWKDGKVSVQELDLVRALISQKLDRGELSYDWS